MGRLRRGDCIWAVGDEQPVLSFDEFTQRLLALTDNPTGKGAPHFVGGISYWLDRSAVWGEYDEVTLTESDLAELRREARPH